MGKIYSQILLNRLNKGAEEEGKILDNQFGFQKGKSTVDCIFTFYSIIAKTLGSKEKLYCAFIDYEKAFDKVDRSFLWQKLMLEKVRSKLVKTLNAMYSVVRSCVRHRSAYSSFFHSYIGLKQGDPCSPILSMLFNMILYNILRPIPMIYSLWMICNCFYYCTVMML